MRHKRKVGIVILTTLFSCASIVFASVTFLPSFQNLPPVVPLERIHKDISSMLPEDSYDWSFLDYKAWREIQSSA